MMNSPTVSVIIPTWNRARTIEAAISSALGQTFSPLEILVCDDGSTDDTEARVRGFDDPRIRWVQGARGGCPAIPRNRGIKAAKGEWLAFLDSDDVWLPKKLERQLQALSLSGTAAACSNAVRSLPGEGEVGAMLPQQDNMLGWREIIPRNQVHCSSVLVRRTLFDKAEGFPETENLRVGEDYALWMRISTMTEFTYLGQPLLVYRDDPANSVRAHSLDGWSERIEVVNDFLEWNRRQNQGDSQASKMAQRQLRTARFRRGLSKIIGRLR